MATETDETMARVARLSETTADDAFRVIQNIYADGVVSRDEAEQLFELRRKLPKTGNAVKLEQRFIEIISEFLLSDEMPKNRVSEHEADWLIAQFSKGSKGPDLIELDLLINLLRKSDAAPERLAQLVLEALANRIITEGLVTFDMVERLRFAMFSGSGLDGLWVGPTEASLLFRINDAVGTAKNHVSWNDFFARAVSNYLTARAHPDPMSDTEALKRELWLHKRKSSLRETCNSISKSIGTRGWFERVMYSPKRAERARLVAQEKLAESARQITKLEGEWLMTRLRLDQKITPAEHALIKFLQAELPGMAEAISEFGSEDTAKPLPVQASA